MPAAGAGALSRSAAAMHADRELLAISDRVLGIPPAGGSPAQRCGEGEGVLGGGGGAVAAGGFQAQVEGGLQAQAGAQASGARAVGGQRHAGVGGHRTGSAGRVQAVAELGGETRAGGLLRRRRRQGGGVRQRLQPAGAVAGHAPGGCHAQRQPAAPAPPDRRAARAGSRQPAATSNAVTLRVSRLNSTPIRWIGSPPPRYLAA